MRHIFPACVAAGLCAGPLAQTSFGALFNLTDNNSVAQFDTATSANQFNWYVDGIDQLAQEAFWFRVGNVAEQSVHTLPIALQGATDGNFDGNPDTLFVRHNGAGFRIDLKYSLSGGTPGSGSADLGEQISIVNQSDGPLDFHFFEYADFDITGPGPGNQAVFTNPNTVRQSNGGSFLTETVVTPVPNHREVAFFPTTLNSLNDAAPTTLSDTPLFTPVGPGDVTWAYEWDFVLQAGDTFLISKDKNLGVQPVPEPRSGGADGTCWGCFAVARRPRAV